MNGQELLYNLIEKNDGKLMTTFDELAEQLNLSKRRVVCLRDRLVEKGLIKSHCINPTGRKKQLILTIIKKGE